MSTEPPKGIALSLGCLWGVLASEGGEEERWRMDKYKKKIATADEGRRKGKKVATEF